VAGINNLKEATNHMLNEEKKITNDWMSKENKGKGIQHPILENEIIK